MKAEEQYPLYLAEVIQDSSANDIRLTTLKVRFPRSVLAEFLTHRKFSRNGASSRAMPASVVRRQVRYAPAMPLVWLKNKKGMQATEPMSNIKEFICKSVWIFGSKLACGISWSLEKLGLHKQWANRVLEPWVTMEMVVSSTDWSNFFELRCHPDAQPEIAKLAYMMKESLRKSKPKALARGEWHTPFVRQGTNLSTKDAVKTSTARNARVSYLTHDKKDPSLSADIKLHDRLVASKPIHASPAEHVATPDYLLADGVSWAYPHLHGNFTGWIQYRGLLENSKPIEEVLNAVVDI